MVLSSCHLVEFGKTDVAQEGCQHRVNKSPSVRNRGYSSSLGRKVVPVRLINSEVSKCSLLGWSSDNLLCCVL
jgi:hypothetical protein